MVFKISMKHFPYTNDGVTYSGFSHQCLYFSSNWIKEVKKYKKSISVVVPVYNESESISTTITRLLEVVNSWNDSYEIIFVNDGSLDNTAAEIQKICKKTNKVKLINF